MACPVGCGKAPDVIRPYGDIAGIGVLLSFILTAFLLVALVVCYYLVIYDPGLDPFRPRDQRDLLCKIPNPVDRLFLSLVRGPFRKLSPKLRQLSVSKYLMKHSLEDGLNKSARTFSDIQIFTGIAILVSGFNTYKCDIQSYHWQLIMYMAWLATVTHASLLSFLRNDLLNHRWQLYWRFGGMFTILTMLVVGIILTPEFTWAGSAPPLQYAKCFEVDRDTAWALIESKIKIIFFLVSGYSIRVMKLFRWFDHGPRWLALKLRRRSVEMQQAPGGHSLLGRFRFTVADPVAIACLRIAHLHVDLWTSFLGEVFWLLVSFIWAVKRLLILRLIFGPKEENGWTFGQVVPLVLLAVPVAALVDHFSHDAADMPETQATATSPDNLAVTPEIDPDYEGSTSFGGVFLLAATMYVHPAVYVLVNDEQTLKGTVTLLALSFLILHPAAQATWIINHRWLTILGLCRPRTNAALGIVSSSLTAVVTSHLVLNVFEGVLGTWRFRLGTWQDSKYEPSFDSMWLVLVLFIPFLVCATAVLLAHQPLVPGAQRRGAPYCRPRRVAVLASGIVLAAAMPLCLFFQASLGAFPGLIGPVLACQLPVFGVEYGIQRRGWRHGTLLRCVALGVHASSLAIIMFFLVRSVAALFALVVCACSLWVLCWALSDTIVDHIKASVEARAS